MKDERMKGGNGFSAIEMENSGTFARVHKNFRFSSLVCDVVVRVSGCVQPSSLALGTAALSGGG